MGTYFSQLIFSVCSIHSCTFDCFWNNKVFYFSFPKKVMGPYNVRSWAPFTIHYFMTMEPHSEFCITGIAIRSKWDFAGKESASPYLAQNEFSRISSYFPSLCFGILALAQVLVMIHGSLSYLKTHLVFTEQHLCFRRGNRSLMSSF